MKRIQSACLVFGVAALLAACGDSPSGPPEPAAVQVSGTVPSTAAVGSSVSVSVRVTDSRGQSLSGVTVTFQVIAGGGTVSQTTVTTNSSGLATVTSWTMGTTPGINTLQATVAGVPSVTVSVSTNVAPFARVSGHNSACPVGTTGCRFSVRVRGSDGAPVSGESIIWTGPGGATLTTITNASGFAVAPNLGTNAGIATHQQTAQRASGGDALSFSYSLVQGGQYNIEIRYAGSISPAHAAAFTAARLRWQEVISGDLPPVQLNISANACKDAEGDVLVSTPAINETIDDLLIYVQVDSIDGPGRVLGSAGPCFIRSTSRLPLFGIMRFDEADLDAMEVSGLLGDVILHELGHVLGFPTIWKDPLYNLLQNEGTSNPFYTGGGGSSLFTLAGGTLVNGLGVPIENSGGEGTRDSHWREAVMGNELMTGFVSAGSNPLSAITIGSLQDIGYEVNFDVADAYTVQQPGAYRGFSSLQFEMIELPMPAPRVVY